MGNDIGWALQKLRFGRKVRRGGWNRMGMYIVLMPELDLPAYNSQGDGPKVNARTAKHIGEHAPLLCKPYIAMGDALGNWQPGWVCSQADLLANDWQEVAES